MNEPATCRKCDMPLDIGAEFCGNCGTAVDPNNYPAPEPPQTAVAAQPDGEEKFNGHATVSLVLGVMAIPGMGFFPIGVPVSIAAFTLGLLGRNSTKKRRAVIGMILGVIGLIGAIAFFSYYFKTGIRTIEGDPGSF